MKNRYFSWRKLFILILILCISALYLNTSYRVTHGRPVAPLDDAYITYQYARQIAKGQIYRYNDGDNPTSGMTSPFFGLFLAIVYKLGITDEYLVAFAVGMGVVWLSLIAWLTFRFSTRFMNKKSIWPWLAVAYVVLSGSVQWSCFNGMETGLFTVLSLAALDAFLNQRITWCAFWLGFAGLTRPEGLILTGVIGAVFLGDALVHKRRIDWRSSSALSFAFITGLIPMIVNLILTGTYNSAGLIAKSWMGNVPAYPVEILNSIWITYRHILFGRFLGKDWYVLPGLLLFGLWGWRRMVKEKLWLPLMVTIIWFFLGTASTASLITAFWHKGRYQIAFIPILIVVSVYGLAKGLDKDAPQWQKITCMGVVLTFFTASLFSTTYHLDIYRRATSTVTRQQLAISEWIRGNLPSDAIVGVHDAGSLRYVGDRPTYDLVGLTTPDAAVAWRHGAGSVYELMEHSPRRPTHFAIYPDVFSIPYLASTDLFADQLFEVNIPDHLVASAGPVQGIWKANWQLADSGDNVVQPDVLIQIEDMKLVDSIDVADLRDETAHNLTWWQRDIRSGFPTELQQQRYHVKQETEVLDGGRLLTGGLSFEIETQPGTDLWLVSRLHAREAGSVAVQIADTIVGDWRYPSIPGEWLDTLFHIPSNFITDKRTRIQLYIDNEVPNFKHYALYYMWAYQGEANRLPVTGEKTIGIQFGDRINLQGFDLPEKSLKVGDELALTLYWLTSDSTDSTAKVFLHLYTTDGTLVAQSDGWSYYGTRPPYTWRAGEIISDPRRFALSSDLVPGNYTLEVGLYDDTGRLPAFIDKVRQPEERVILTTIQIQDEGTSVN